MNFQIDTCIAYTIIVPTEKKKKIVGEHGNEVDG